LTHIDKKYIHI